MHSAHTCANCGTCLTTHVYMPFPSPDAEHASTHVLTHKAVSHWKLLLSVLQASSASASAQPTAPSRSSTHRAAPASTSAQPALHVSASTQPAAPASTPAQPTCTPAQHAEHVRMSAQQAGHVSISTQPAEQQPPQPLTQPGNVARMRELLHSLAAVFPQCGVLCINGMGRSELEAQLQKILGSEAPQPNWEAGESVATYLASRCCLGPCLGLGSFYPALGWGCSLGVGDGWWAGEMVMVAVWWQWCHCNG